MAKKIVEENLFFDDFFFFVRDDNALIIRSDLLKGFVLGKDSLTIFYEDKSETVPINGVDPRIVEFLIMNGLLVEKSEEKENDSSSGEKPDKE